MERAMVRMTIVVALACLVAGCANSNKAAESKTTPSAEFKTTPAAMEDAAASRSPIIGKTAPDFTLLDQDSKPITLSKLRGQWVVLYFYPKDDTPGCTCEATEFTKLMKQMSQPDARVLGISTDSVETHKIFVGQYNLGIDLLSDPDHKVMEEYGAWVTAALGPNQYGRVIRSTMIIDPNGVIRYHWPEVMPQGHAARVHAKLKQLQAQANSSANKAS